MRGSITKRGDSWLIRFDVGYETDPKTGKQKRKQKSITFRGSRKEAEVKLTELLRTVHRNEYVEPTKMTVAEWLDEWLEMIESSGRRTPRTVETYASDIENHIKPKLGAIRMQNLQATDLQLYYNGLDLAGSTKQKHHTIIHSALEAAVRLGYLTRNVSTLVPDKPKKDESPDDLLDNCWNPSEVRKFLEAAKEEGIQAEAFYTLALGTGVRKGELCGLKWTDVDFKNNTVRVARTLQKPGADPVFGPPKNKQPRTITVAPMIMKLLQKHKLHQNEVKMKNRKRYNDHGLVFAKEWGELQSNRDGLGNPVQMNNIGQRQFAKLIKKAGVKKIKFHGMRHTFVTLALANGTQPHVVQRMLGHKLIEITLGIYGHVLPAMQEEAAEKMAALFMQ